jgi:hypothetical protein
MSVKPPRTLKFMAHEPGFTIIDAMNRLFPAWFDSISRRWRMLRLSMGARACSYLFGRNRASVQCCPFLTTLANPTRSIF